jgi:hypothetical protein
LQLGAHRSPLGAGLAQALSEDPEQIMGVVAVFVREYVGLREWAPTSAEAGAELIEEAKVDVNPFPPNDG